MEQRVKTNNRGMSLIEVLFAMVLLMIVGLALMQTALVGYRENTKNLLRDEAVSVAEQTMNDLRARTFSSTYTDAVLSSTGGALVSASTPTVTRDFRGFQVNYGVKKAISDINVDIKQVTVEVSWNTRGRDYKHTITNIMRTQ